MAREWSKPVILLGNMNSSASSSPLKRIRGFCCSFPCSSPPIISTPGVSFFSFHLPRLCDRLKLIRNVWVSHRIQRLQRSPLYHSCSGLEQFRVLDISDIRFYLHRIRRPRPNTVPAKSSCLCWLGPRLRYGIRRTYLGLLLPKVSR